MEYQVEVLVLLGTVVYFKDYLKYLEERKDRLMEIYFAIEGEKANDRNSNSNWDGNILHGYK